jgi:hypothetical protein
MQSKAGANGIEKFKTVVGEMGTRNKWGEVDYRVAKFPLWEDNITKDVIYNFWNDKPVRFAYRNNCVMCVNRQPLMISHMATKEKRKVEWAKKMESNTSNQFLTDASMSKILNYSVQGNLFNEDDFSDCDSGYCGI